MLSIQYLRGIAAIAVAVCHAGGHAGVPLVTGAAGVDIFFVISGFIMWTVTTARPVKPGAFLLDRVTRIVPPYALLTVLIYLVATFVPGAFPNMQTNIRHLLLSLAFIPHTDPYGTAFPVVVPGWTLDYEMFFYLLFAGSLWFSARQRIWACSLGFAGLVLTGCLLARPNALLAMCTNPLLLEFAAGAWLGVAWRRAIPQAGWGFLALAAGIAWLVGWHFTEGVQPVQLRALVWGVPAALIVGGLLTIERGVGLFRSRLLLLAGNTSYAIYLINVFVLAAVWRALGRFGVPLYLVAGVGVTLGCGVVFWLIVERPSTLLFRHLVRRPAPAAILEAPSTMPMDAPVVAAVVAEPIV